ncbi:hypothetical protein [Eleftheria terrae]|uniref:hypothetical protein n=1 Tax=Eleftheria terrae TaxID=1597781 RepID=UPI00263A67F5|nr:hypothetical protein [Eleftheria terrae]WKB52320.1 hypothetical protein N7L95_21390 [Eleftheria terrae]
MAIERNIAGAWSGCVPWVRHAGEWREARGVWRHEAGAWRRVYEHFDSSILVVSAGGAAGGNRRIGAWGTLPRFKGAEVALTYTLTSNTTTLHITGQWPASFITQLVLQDENGYTTVHWRKDAVHSVDSSTTWRWRGSGLPMLDTWGHLWLKG